MSIFLVKGTKENLNKSIVNNVDLEFIKSYNFTNKTLNKLINHKEEIFCWAWKTRKSNGMNNLKAYRESIKEDDIFLFVQNGRKSEDENAQTIMYKGEVICCDTNSKFASELWDYNKGFDFIIFIKNIQSINKTVYLEEHFMNIIRGQKTNFGRTDTYKLNENEEKIAFEKFSDDILSGNSEFTFKEENKPNINRNIKKLEKLLGVQSDLDIKEIEKKSSRKNTNKNVKGANKNTSNNDIDEYSKRLIGYLGEEKVFYMIKNKNDRLFDMLNIDKNDYKDIVWFNEGEDIKSDTYEDKSVGYGYDMYVESKTGKNIYLEIKSSYNKMNLVNFTQNEIKVMKKNKKEDKDYYVVLVDKLKNLENNKKPYMNVINNFSQDIDEKYIDISNIHTLYSNKLIERYNVKNRN